MDNGDHVQPMLVLGVRIGFGPEDVEVALQHLAGDVFVGAADAADVSGEADVSALGLEETKGWRLPRTGVEHVRDVVLVHVVLEAVDPLGRATVVQAQGGGIGGRQDRLGVGTPHQEHRAQEANDQTSHRNPLPGTWSLVE